MKKAKNLHFQLGENLHFEVDFYNHKVKILHNNYWITEDGKRVSISGFHQQYDGKEISGVHAVNGIINYKKHYPLIDLYGK